MRFPTRLGAILLVALAAACSPSGAPSFKATDITGAEYGKSFRLTDHAGKERTLSDFGGKAVVVFFGFTHCPDVCPTTLAAMRAVLEQLGGDAQRVQVLFVTVDPERDTRELLAQYVPSFHPSFIGLYGDAEATARVAKDFKVFYQKVPGTTPGSYTMDHSAGSYVFDPQGRLRLYVRHGASPEDIAADLKLLLAGK
ncbi:MAG: SCO family protein [Burkholderiales bacterium]|jgi:protein SCO1/2|nr:SCO family protein [Burkholderiales bacterium]